MVSVFVCLVAPKLFISKAYFHVEMNQNLLGVASKSRTVLFLSCVSLAYYTAHFIN